MRAVIFDLDGTISDPSGRLYHLDGEKDWKSFHAAAGDDTPITSIIQLLRMLYKAAEAGDGLDAVLIVTARHDAPNFEQLTRDWLEIEEVPFHRLYMRKDADTRPDHVVKEEILQQIIEDGYEPVLAVDDRPSVVAMWRSKGITTLQCAPDEPGSSIYAGQTLLHMLVGPCGAGKSTYAEKHYLPHEIISTDVLRLQLYGNLGHAPEALARVWQLAHGLIKARLNAGVLTVLDATNLDQDDRLRVLSLLPRGVFARYVILDRDLREKETDRGWRSMDMILQQHKMFRAEERNIKAGDNHPYVTVQDKR